MRVELYPSARSTSVSFRGVKRMTVPGQSLSLREIVRRFVRREALPVNAKDGVYEHRFGDLEKISKLDLVEQHEIIDSLKVKIADFNAREKARVAKEAEEKVAAEKEEFERRVAEGIAKGATVQTAPVK